MSAAFGSPELATNAGSYLAQCVTRAATSLVSGAACHAEMESTQWQRETSAGAKAVARESTAASLRDGELSGSKRQIASVHSAIGVE